MSLYNHINYYGTICYPIRLQRYSLQEGELVLQEIYRDWISLLHSSLKEFYNFNLTPKNIDSDRESYYDTNFNGDITVVGAPTHLQASYFEFFQDILQE